jgi:hypothetical protein
MPELLLGLAEYFVFYNDGRYHQALGYKTPDQVYLTGEGEVGGAKIVDYYSDKQDSSEEEMGQRQSAVTEPIPSQTRLKTVWTNGSTLVHQTGDMSIAGVTRENQK